MTQNSLAPRRKDTKKGKIRYGMLHKIACCVMVGFKFWFLVFLCVFASLREIAFKGSA